MRTRVLAILFALAAAALAAGCAGPATSIDAQWMSPSLGGRDKVQNVLVVAALRDSTLRRMLEDRTVETLAASGVKAMPSHRYFADGAQVSEAQLRKAVADAGAAYVLLTSISGTTTDVRVTQQMMMGPGWGPGWGSQPGMAPGWNSMSAFYSASWNRSISTGVRTTQTVHGDTRLFDARSSEVVWSAATRTVPGYQSVQIMVDQFAALIVETLRRGSVL
jgi:hypothetical protein